MVVFLYLAACLTALGLAWFVPGERLTPLRGRRRDSVRRQ